MKKLLLLFTSLSFMTMMIATPVLAIDPLDPVCNTGADEKPQICDRPDPNENTVVVVVKRAISMISIITGIAAVIMVTISAIRITVKGNDSAEISKAKNSIIYAMIGLVISISAFVIVNYVLANLGEGA